MHVRVNNVCVKKKLTECTKPCAMVPRPPRPVSLVELITLGYLAEEDVLPGGHVEEGRRRCAELQYLSSRPRTATARGEPARRPERRPWTARGRTTVAHVHRVHVRRDVQGTDRIPARLVVDTCCICLAHSRDHAVVPCFHMCVCAICAARIQRCPLCRGPAERIQRIYA